MMMKLMLFQVFLHLANLHLDEINQWNNQIPVINIGGGGLQCFQGFQGFERFPKSGFLTDYNSNWSIEYKDKQKKKLTKKVNFCSSSYINYCDTNSLFLTPLKKKSLAHKNNVDFKTICRVL